MPFWSFFTALFLLFVSSSFALDLERLTPTDIRLRKTILKTLKPIIDQKKHTGVMNVMPFEELYQPLSSRERQFLDDIRSVNPKTLGATAHAFGDPPADVFFVSVPVQWIDREGKRKALPRQFLPQPVYEAYTAMMRAMEKDLGKVLYIESGFRSPAYQLYLFLYYLSNHNYSIRENNRFVALPGHSEHGAPERQAIDFINEQGINGEEDPEAFEVLPEYVWLQQHAQEYGFVLSYPRGNPWGTSFEPWHWHFDPS